MDQKGVKGEKSYLSPIGISARRGNPQVVDPVKMGEGAPKTAIETSQILVVVGESRGKGKIMDRKGYGRGNQQKPKKNDSAEFENVFGEDHIACYPNCDKTTSNRSSLVSSSLPKRKASSLAFIVRVMPSFLRRF